MRNSWETADTKSDCWPRQRDLAGRRPVEPIGGAERHQDGGSKPQRKTRSRRGRTLALAGHDRRADDERQPGIVRRQRQAAGAAIADQRLALEAREGNGQPLRVPDRSPRGHDVRAAHRAHSGLYAIGDPHRQHRGRPVIDQPAATRLQLATPPRVPERVGRLGPLDGG